jgi:hypothetical protein
MPLTQVQNGMLAGVIPASLGGTGTTAGVTGFKNRLINGNMTISQRNGTSSVTPATNIYTLDRWYVLNSVGSKFSVQQDAGAVTPPAGFTDYLGITSLAATSVGSADYYQVAQNIEGFNIADLGWGTANAKTITFSFWVRSSLTGTFGGTILNSGESRSYPYSYTINAANTWEYKTVTIPGDTTGTWLTTNGIGIQVRFSLGMGSTYSTTANAWIAGVYGAPTGAVSVVSTNGATFYVTGCQFEVGSAATNFDVRSYTNELQLCQRYFQRFGDTTYAGIASGVQGSTTYSSFTIIYPVPMRTSPTLTFSNLIVTERAFFDTAVSSISFSHIAPTNLFVAFNHTSSGAYGNGVLLCVANSGTGFLNLNAEF